MANLTNEEKEMLEGKHGEAKRLSMALLVKALDAYKAERLIPISSCHLVLSFQKTSLTAGLETAERFVKLGAKCAVPTSIDTSSMDFERWEEFRFPKDFMEDQFRMKAALEALGAIPTWSCVPYEGGGVVPRFGQHIAWTESSTAPYVNSLIGARTNRVGAYEDLASAITGRTPYYGLHLDENRLGNILIEVKTDLTPGDYNVFGSWVGEVVENKIPVITGIPKEVRPLDLRYFGASGAATGSLALYHMPGITAEFRTVEEAFGGKKIPQRVEFGAKELKERTARMSSIKGGKIDLVVIGCPHLTMEGLIDLANRIKGRKVKVETYVLTNKVSKEMAKEMGVAKVIEDAGMKLNTGCCAWSPVELCGFPEHFTVMANSGKQAWYVPSLLTQMRPGKPSIIYGDVDACIEGAVKGEA
jgi:predicted aconitase